MRALHEYTSILSPQDRYRIIDLPVCSTYSCRDVQLYMYIADLTTFNIRKEQYSTVQAVQLYEYAAGTEQHISCWMPTVASVLISKTRMPSRTLRA